MEQTTKEYISKLYRKSLQELQAVLGSRGERMLTASKIILVSVGLLLLLGLGIVKENGPIYDGLFNGLVIDGVLFLLLFVVERLWAVFRMPALAAKQDGKQRNDIEKLRGRMERRQVAEVAIGGLVNLYFEGNELHQEGRRSRVSKASRSKQEEWWGDVRDWYKKATDFIENSFDKSALADFGDITTLSEMDDGHKNRLAALRARLENIQNIRRVKENDKRRI